MIVSELINMLSTVNPNSEVVLVVYTDNSYESGYIDRIDTNARYNSVTGDRLGDDESIVELTTSTKVKK